MRKISYQILISTLICLVIIDSFQLTTFIRPDIFATIKINEFNSVQIEAFLYESHKTLNFDSNKTNDYVWVSVGYPTFVPILTSINDSFNKTYFNFKPEYFYSFIEMLTDSHKISLKETIKYKYNYDIDIDHQIFNMPLERFECQTLLFDDETNETFSINGKVKNFFNFPLKLHFDYNKNSRNRLLFEKRLNQIALSNRIDEEISFDCELVSQHLFKSNMIFDLKLQEILLKFDLLKDSNEALINKYQLGLIAEHIYNNLDGKIKYNLSESLSIEGSIERVSSNEFFDFINFDQAIINLSTFGFDQEINKNLFDLFKIENENNKTRIRINNDKKNISNILGFDIKNVLDFIQKRENDWFSLTEVSFDDQIKELNSLRDIEIQWYRFDDKILPKAIKVLKIDKDLLKKMLIFNQSQNQIQYFEFKKNLTININANSILNAKQLLNVEKEQLFSNLTNYLNNINYNLSLAYNELIDLKLILNNNIEKIKNIEESLDCKQDKQIIFKNENGNPTNCYELFLFNSNSKCLKSGIYNIYPDGINPLSVFCEANKNGSWTRIMNRIDETMYFDKKYNNYLEGFGMIKNNCWIGLKNIRKMVQTKPMSLRIELKNETASSFIEYETFYVDSEVNGFKLKIENKINGDLPDSFSYHNGAKFSTFDKSQDGNNAACPLAYNAGWWFVDCYGFCPTCSNKLEALYKPGNWFFPPYYWGVYNDIKMYLRPQKNEI